MRLNGWAQSSSGLDNIHIKAEAVEVREHLPWTLLRVICCNHPFSFSLQSHISFDFFVVFLIIFTLQSLILFDFLLFALTRITSLL